MLSNCKSFITVSSYQDSNGLIYILLDGKGEESQPRLKCHFLTAKQIAEIAVVAYIEYINVCPSLSLLTEILLLG